jgi:hypothetical protein
MGRILNELWSPGANRSWILNEQGNGRAYTNMTRFARKHFLTCFHHYSMTCASRTQMCQIPDCCTVVYLSHWFGPSKGHHAEWCIVDYIVLGIKYNKVIYTITLFQLSSIWGESLDLANFVDLWTNSESWPNPVMRGQWIEGESWTQFFQNKSESNACGGGFKVPIDGCINQAILVGHWFLWTKPFLSVGVIGLCVYMIHMVTWWIWGYHSNSRF